MLFEIDTLLLVGGVLLSLLALMVAVRPIVYRRMRAGPKRSVSSDRP